MNFSKEEMKEEGLRMNLAWPLRKDDTHKSRSVKEEMKKEGLDPRKADVKELMASIERNGKLTSEYQKVLSRGVDQAKSDLDAARNGASPQQKKRNSKPAPLSKFVPMEAIAEDLDAEE